MRVEILFLRWLLIIAIIVIGVGYARSSRQNRPEGKYETIPLIQGGRSSGMPLVGVAIDPNRRDVFAVLGGPKEKQTPETFFIVWKGKEGGTYSTAFAGEQGLEALCEMSRDGQVRMVHTFSPTPGETFDQQMLASMESALRSIVEALPANSGLRANP